MAGEVELERMVVRLLGDVTQYVKSLKEAQDQANATAKKIEEQSKKIEGFTQQVTGYAKAAVGAIAGLGVAEWVHRTVEGFGRFEKSQLGLKAVVEANGRSADFAMAEYKKFQEEILRTTHVTRGASTEMLKEAEVMGLSGEQAQKAIRNAIGLAGALGGEAQSHIRVAIAMEQGNVHMLRRILHMHDEHDESVILAKAQKVIEAGYKAVQEGTRGVAGATEELNEAWEMLSRQFGKFLADQMLPLIRGTKDIIEGFTNLSETAKKWIATGAVTVAGFLSLSGVVKVVTGVLSTLRPMLIAIGGATLSLGRAAVSAGASMWTAAAAAGPWGIAIAAGATALGFLTAGLLELDKQAAATWPKLIKISDVIKQTKAEMGAKTEAKLAEIAVTGESPEAKIKLLQEAFDEAGKEGTKLWEDIKKVREELAKTPNIPALTEYRNQLRATEAQLGTTYNALAEAQEKYTQKIKELTEGAGKKLQDQTKQLLDKLKEKKDFLDSDFESEELYKLAIQNQGMAYSETTARLIEEAKAMQESVKAAEELRSARKELETSTKQMEEDLQLLTEGLELNSREAKIRRLELRGLTEAETEHARSIAQSLDIMDEQKKLMEDAAKITEEFRDPWDKFNDTIENLQEHLAAGRISWETFSAAAEKAADDLEKATEETKKAREELTKFDAAEAGSAEAATRIAAFRDMVAAQVPSSTSALAQNIIAGSANLVPQTSPTAERTLPSMDETLKKILDALLQSRGFGKPEQAPVVSIEGADIGAVGY